MKKRKIYMVSPWMILLTCAVICAVIAIDVIWLRWIWEKEKMSLLLWFCAGQMLFWVPLNYCIVQLKKCILCDNRNLWVYLTERNQYLRIPKSEITGMKICAEDEFEPKPDEIEELEEFSRVKITFYLKNGRQVDVTSNYMNGKNILRLYEELN